MCAHTHTHTHTHAHTHAHTRAHLRGYIRNHIEVAVVQCQWYALVDWLVPEVLLPFDVWREWGGGGGGGACSWWSDPIHVEWSGDGSEEGLGVGWGLVGRGLGMSRKRAGDGSEEGLGWGLG